MLQVLSESSQWIVINKPAGLSVHNDADNVLTRLKKRVFPVHRLDQETSGVLLIAKSAEVAADLQEIWPEGLKTYAAILRGVLPETSGEWTWPLSDKGEGRKNPQGLSRDRKPCATRFHSVRSNDYVTQVDCELRSGRQHQIRKHAAIAGHAILGDHRYNDPKYNTRIASLFGTERMFLHARELRLRFGGREHVFTAPLPAEFNAVFA